MINKKKAMILRTFALLLLLVALTNAACTDFSPSPSDTCIGSNSTPGACCLNNALCATPSSVTNANPTTSTRTLTSTTASYTTLGFTGSSNYPLLYYALVNWTVGAYTYAPFTSVAATMGAPSSNVDQTFSVQAGWAGTYDFTFETPYCNATGRSLYFTRSLFLQSKVNANDATPTVLCSATPTTLGRSRCDCSRVNCYAGLETASCESLYPTCTSACAHILSPKPVTFNIGAPLIGTGGGGGACSSLTTQSCSCATQCQDGIVDSAENCDVGATGGQYGSCCTTNCLAPNTGVPATLAYTYSTCTSTISLVDIQMDIAAHSPNFATNIELVSVTGVAGLSAVSLSSTFLTLNGPYTGTAILTFRTLYCNSTSEYITLIRTVSMTACCNNNVINIGENCDIGASGNGAPGTCCTSQCTFVASSQVCRAALTGSNGTCDVAEYCTGTSPACPVDGYATAGSTCGSSTQVGCRDFSRCLGNSTVCPAPLPLVQGTVCNAGGACSSASYCDGTSLLCPAQFFYNSSVVCRASAGSCDIPEYCTGSSSSCPFDSKQPNGLVCRGVAGACDAVEVCNGVSSTCPSDSYQPNTVVCRVSSGPCDFPEYCSGSSIDCSSDFLASAGTVCRAAVGSCDVAEVCDGLVASCPLDAYASLGAICRPSAGDCDLEELCNGFSTECGPDTFYSSSTICRASIGGCDAPEYCTGTSISCPADLFLPINTVCDASLGACESNAVCDGSSVTCPSKTIFPSSAVCRDAVGPCDAPEFCDGSTAICPADALRLSSYACSPSLGPCMPTTYCSGSSTTCTPLPYYGNATVCRPAVSNCDIADYCTGNSYACNTDAVRPVGYVCQVSTDPCQFNSTCTGFSTLCNDFYSPVNSACHYDANRCYTDRCLSTGVGLATTCTRGPLINYDDGLYCNGIETCNPSTGLKVSGTPIICNDNTSCTNEACSNALAACVYTPVQNSQGPCGLGVGACSLGSHTCDGNGSTPILACVGSVDPVAEICGNSIDDNCNGQIDEYCTPTFCNTTQDCLNQLTLGDCVSATCILGQCNVVNKPFGTQCSDGIRCTTHDQCNGVGSCTSIPLVCDDFNDCTFDYCDEAFGWCVFDGTAYEGDFCATTDACSINSQCSNQGLCESILDKDCSIFTSPCGEAICNATTGECDVQPIVGPWCDDGDACTFNDVCTASGCVGSPKNCDDYNDCTEDSCHSPDGTCIHTLIEGHCLLDELCYTDGYVYPYRPFAPCWSCNVNTSTISWTPVPDGTTCDDNDLCTSNDACDINTGMCTGVPMDCSFLDTDCAVGKCFYGVCVSDPINSGSTCDDGLYCTLNDKCSSDGQCIGEQRDCGGFDGSCNIGVCDEGSASCVAQPIVDYTKCPMFASACDGETYCLAGVCTTSDPVVCDPSPNSCISSECDSDYGCIEVPYYNTACDDQNVCTIGDFCGGDSVCYPGYITLNCDDSNPCTDDRCDAVLGCVNTPIANCEQCNVNLDCSAQSCQVGLCIDHNCVYIAQSGGARCSDNNACNGEEFCTGNGVCISILLPNCDDNNDCTVDSCDPSSGCVFTPTPGNMCDDHDPTTVSDVCVGSVCTGTPFLCPDDTPCLTYTRHIISGNPTCIGVPINIDGSCVIDGDPCQVGGICSAYGQCLTHDLICPMTSDCTSSYACVNGACVAQHDLSSVACNVENLCSTSHCDGAGSCIVDSGSEIICPTSDQCQVTGQCVPETGQCAPIFIDDFAICAVDDGYCYKGACILNGYTASMPTDQCHGASLFDELTSTSYFPLLVDNSPCDEFSACASTSMCSSGTCTTVNMVECDEYEGNPCFVGSCDIDYGCLYEFADGVSCDDDDLCTLDTTCLSGTCSQGTPKNCYNEYFCGVSYCSPEYGCLFSMDNDCRECTDDCDCPVHPCKRGYCDAGTCAYEVDDRQLRGCDDGVFCNGQEHCEMGSCFLDRPPSCNDHNECTQDTCDYNVNQCVYSPLSGSSCNSNSDKCALESQCDMDGHCLTTSSYACDTSNPCRISAGCSKELGVCEYIILNDGVPCASDDLCSARAECHQGQCVSVEEVDCIADTWCFPLGACDSTTGSCVYSQVLEDYPCSDDNWCTLGDTCSFDGTCVPGAYSPCDNIPIDDQCQVRSCTSSNQSCSVIDLNNDEPCSTGLATGPCSGDDVCRGGRCVRTYNTGLVCREADLTGCDILDRCVEGNDFCPQDTRSPDGSSCQNDLFCYTNVCQGGRCVIDQARDCSIYNTECTEAYCDEATQQCNYRNLPNGLSCTGTEFGQCVAYSACYYGTCQTYYSDENVPCNDGNMCTNNDHCSGFDGSCSSGDLVNCSAIISPCSLGECNPLTGQCFSQTIDNITCDADNDPCTIDDSCYLGECVAGPQLDCSYLDSACQYGVCQGGSCTAIVTDPSCGGGNGGGEFCFGNCTVPFAWWSVHNSKCTGDKQFKWPANLEKTKICGDTYYDWSQKRQGAIAWRLLFNQWLGATLNKANGACVPNSTSIDLANAYTLLFQCNMTILTTDQVLSSNYKSLATSLYSYNNGVDGPGLCNPAACSIPPYGDTTCLFDGARNSNTTGDGSCINGIWNEGLLTCDCYVGWTGTECTSCAVPVDPGYTYVCVPSLNSPWAYTLRYISNSSLKNYIGDSKKAYKIVQMTGRAAVLAGTGGLDCSCRDLNVISANGIQYYNFTVGDDALQVYISAINSDLDLCSAFFDVTISGGGGSCSIDGVQCQDDDTDWSSICDCCRDDDDNCACPRGDRLCLRNHVIAEMRRADRCEAAFVVTTVIAAVAVAILLTWLLINVMKRSDDATPPLRRQRAQSKSPERPLLGDEISSSTHTSNIHRRQGFSRV